MGGNQDVERRTIMASTTTAAGATGPTLSKLRGSLARFPAEIAAADAESAAAQARAAELRAAQKKAERELEHIVGPASDRLIEAARQDDVGEARAALESGANPNRPTPVVEGWDADDYDAVVDEAMLSALGWAAKRGNQEMATLLIDQGGADPNQARTADGYTALMHAAHGGHPARAWVRPHGLAPSILLGARRSVVTTSDHRVITE